MEIREEKTAFILRVADDGAGINFKNLLVKAIAMGLVSRNDSITRETITNLIFHPGLSTAEKITDISGRGVGMDAVKQAIESANGTIRVQSTPGKGSEFIVSMPRNAGCLEYRS